MRDMTATARARAAFRTAPLVVAATAFALAIAGCAAGPAANTAPTSAGRSATATETATPTDTPTSTPTGGFVPGGTAAQNLAYFDTVNRATLAAHPNATGRDFIDALVAAGFAKADMQVTPDTTTISLQAPSVQFSVRMGTTCLIGQNGAGADGYWSMVTPVLSTGNCLIGQTRAIDW